jgi:hypothetical protein
VIAVILGPSGAGVRELLEAFLELERPDADGADLADAGLARRQPGRLEVDDDEGRVLEQLVDPRRRRQSDEVAAPAEPRVVADGLLQEAAREADRQLRQREQMARRLLRGHGPAPLLDELDETVGGIQAQLHAADPTRTCVRAPG